LSRDDAVQRRRHARRRRGWDVEAPRLPFVEAFDSRPLREDHSAANERDWLRFRNKVMLGRVNVISRWPTVHVIAVTNWLLRSLLTSIQICNIRNIYVNQSLRFKRICRFSIPINLFWSLVGSVWNIT
jgi:hypothetical protein